jgi:hypothetical protein
VFAANTYHIVVLYNSLGEYLQWDDYVFNSIVPILMVLMSCVVDAFAVIVIRKQFADLQRAATGVRVLSRIGILSLIAVCTYVVPFYLGTYIFETNRVFVGTPWWKVRIVSFFDNGLIYLGQYDLITAIYCLIPCLVLVGLIFHKLLWPLLAQATYPLLNFRIIQERKILIPIGTITLGYAFGGEHIVLKLIEKLG